MQREVEHRRTRPLAAAGSLAARWWRRLRAGARYGAMRVRRVRSALSFAGLLALVCLMLFSPLLLDDLTFRTSYLLRPSQDAWTIPQPTLLSEHPRLTLLAGTLSVPPALSGKARTGEALAALVKGGSARLALKGPVFQLDIVPLPLDADPGAGLDQALHAFMSPLLSALDDAAFETLMIRDGQVNLRTTDGRDIVFDQLSADVSVKRRTAMRIKGSVSYRGQQVAFDTTLGSRIGRRGAARMPIKAQLTSALFSASFDGRLDVSGALVLTAASEIAIPNIRTVARWLGHPWPSGPGLKDFTARGALEWSRQAATIQKGVFRVDGNEGEGTLSMTATPDRPAIAGTLAFDTLDLNPYAAQVVAAGQTGTSLLAQFKAARDLTLPLAGLINADVRFSAEKFTLGSLQGLNGAASLTLREGQLLLDVAEVGLPGGGRAHGEIAIQGWTTTPNYAVKGQVADIDLGEAATALTGVALVRGRGGLGVNVRASGSSGLDVLSKLSGKVDFSMPEGGSVSCSIRSIALAAQAGETPEAGSVCRTSTTVEPLKATATLANGIVAIDRFEAVSGGDQLRMTGTVDLVASFIDVTASAQPIAAGEANREIVKVRGRPEAPALAAIKPQ